jgi:hypothetical protein
LANGALWGDDETGVLFSICLASEVGHAVNQLLRVVVASLARAMIKDDQGVRLSLFDLLGLHETVGQGTSLGFELSRFVLVMEISRHG